MYKLNQQVSQQGVIAHFLLVLLLVVGVVVGVYLIQQKTNLFPKASVSQPTGPETSFTLVGPTGCTAGILCALYGQPTLGEEFTVKLYARSDIEAANLFIAKMTFPKDLVAVKEIKTEGSFVQNWVENFYGNNTGDISLVGGVPAPGYQTAVGGESALMATIVFRAKTPGKGSVVFTDASAVLSNLNNINILTIKRPYDIAVVVKPSPTPAPTPSPTCKPRPVCLDDTPSCMISEPSGGWCPTPTPVPTCMPKPACLDAKPDWVCKIPEPAEGWCPPVPSPTPSGLKGDGNGDGKIDLADMSLLLTDWRRTKDMADFHEGIDMNNDRVINSFDSVLLRALLLQLGVIKTR